MSGISEKTANALEGSTSANTPDGSSSKNWTEEPQLVEPHCERCPLKDRKQVGSKGYITSAFVIVGQSPGNTELREGRPFVGESGKVLHAIIPEEDYIYVTNALRCMPPKRVRQDLQLMKQAVKCCQARLQSELSAYPRKLILTLGNEALWSTTNNFHTKITQIRGSFQPGSVNGIDIELGIMPALHPAALLRGMGSWRQFKADLTRAERLASDQEFLEPQPEVEFIDVEEDWEEWEVKEIIAELLQEPKLTCDLETCTFDPLGDPVITQHFPDPNSNILLIGITSSDGRGIKYHFLPCWLQLLKPLFESSHIEWNWQNGKFDLGFLWEKGIRARVDDDVMLLSYALDETPGIHDLDTLGADYLHTPLHKPMLDQWLTSKKASYATIPRNVLCNYLGYDLDKTARLLPILKGRVEDDPHLNKLYHKILLPASDFLTRLEQTGFTADPHRVAENEVYYAAELERINQEAWKLLGKQVNLGSPLQMKVVLYKDLGLPNRFKGSTDAHALENLPQVPFVKLLREFRKTSKAYGTYVKPVLVNWIGADGRVHSTYLLHGTPTGRLASRKPNLQNIPRLARLKGTFVSAVGYVLIANDLSQAELRSLAICSLDEALCKIYLEGLDLHDEVATTRFGLGFTKENRVRAKNINYGIIYGITKYGLADQAGIEPQEAQGDIDSWFARFPQAKKFLDACRAAPKKFQTIITPFGRKKRPSVTGRESMSARMNEAANMPHQSIASDITLLAAISLVPVLPIFGARIVNIVHDDIIIECPAIPDVIKDVARIARRQLRRTPIQWGLKAIPFESDSEIGTRWGYAKKFAEKGRYNRAEVTRAVAKAFLPIKEH